MYKRNSQGWLKHIDFIIVDALILELVYFVASFIKLGYFPYLSKDYRTLGLFIIVVDILTAAVFNTMHNVLKRGYYKELVHTLNHCVIVFGMSVVIMFTTKSGGVYSRTVVFFTFGGHVVLGYLWRIIWKKVVKQFASSQHKTAMILVADEKLIPEIVEHKSPTDDFEYVGVILSNGSGDYQIGDKICGLDIVADLENAADYICRVWVDEVFIYPSHLHELEQVRKKQPAYAAAANSMHDEIFGGDPEQYSDVYEDGTIAALIDQCRQMAVPVHLRLPLNNISGKSFMEKVGGYNVLTKTTNYATPGQLAVKRAIDILGGLIGSILTLLVLAVVAPMIKKASPGPVLFKQVRIGRNGKKFKMYKIRTMYLDAEERKAELMKENRIADGMMFKMDHDPRIIGNKVVNGKKVTGLGEFLRKTSIDELPQLFNVLKGQMSLVGTRPPTVDEWEKYKYHHRARLATKPGLTGMWQVSGRSDITDFEEVVRLDTEYINNWSISLDIKILLKTVKIVLGGDGAM